MTDAQLLSVLTGILGLAVGSFLNVVIHRVPDGASLLRPSSSCPGCGARIAPRDNVPVVSWLLLRGRCRRCAAPISARYPAVEILTGVLFVLVTLRLGATWALPAYLYAAAMGVALAVIDIRVHRLPDAIVFPSYGVLAVLLTVAAAAEGEWRSLVGAVLGGLVLFGAYLVIMIAHPAGMGPGDVKLAGLLGGLLGWFGWGVLAVGGFAAFLFGGLFGLTLMLVRRADGKTQVPFGPWMILGAAVGIAWGPELWSAYIGLML